MDAIITGKNIVKTFGRGEEKAYALNGVDIEISKGEFVAVMGPSGSGKSTLLFALSGTDDITDGAVKFEGVELSSLNDNALADIRRRRMGFVFQQPTMLKNLDLLDNIILPALPDGRKELAAATQKAERLMERTGIAGLGGRGVTEVSGGQLQRAGICRALINDPDILFADEPTGSLNSQSANEIMSLIVGVNKAGTAVLLVTHDAKVAARADRVLFARDGMIVSETMLGESDGDDTETMLGKPNEDDIEERAKRVQAQMAAVGV